MPDGYAILLSPKKGETAVYGCHCPVDMVVHMRKVLGIPRSWYCALVMVKGVVYNPCCHALPITDYFNADDYVPNSKKRSKIAVT